MKVEIEVADIFVEMFSDGIKKENVPMVIESLVKCALYRTAIDSINENNLDVDKQPIVDLLMDETSNMYNKGMEE